MGRAFDQIAGVEVIRTDPHHEQPVDERLHHLGVVIHAGKEDRLVAQRHAGERQALAGGRELAGDLLRMIGVDAQPDRPVLAEDLGELGRDTLRQEDRDARSEADELDVLDRAEAAEERVQLRVGKQERVAAGEQDVTDLRVGLDVLQAGFELRMEVIRLGVRDQAAARAVAAIGSAAVGDQEEHAVRVTMDDARHGHGAFFADGVLGFARGDIGLLDARDDLPADRAIRVLGVDEVEEMRRDRQRELVRGEEAPFPLLLGEHEHLFQLGQRRDPVAQLPMPVVPLRGGHVFPSALAGMPVFAEVLRIHRLSPLP